MLYLPINSVANNIEIWKNQIIFCPPWSKCIKIHDHRVLRQSALSHLIFGLLRLLYEMVASTVDRSGSFQVQRSRDNKKCQTRLVQNILFPVLTTLTAMEKEEEELRMQSDVAGRNKGQFSCKLGRISKRRTSDEIDSR